MEDNVPTVGTTDVDMDEVARIERWLLESDDGTCPVCGAVEWWHHGHRIEDNQIFQLVTCQSCRTKYLEIYDLRSIEIKQLKGIEVPIHYGQVIQDNN